MHYPQCLTRMQMAELRQNAEDSAHQCYIMMLDYITLLEDKNRLLERKNRELRGEVARRSLGNEKV